MMRMVVVPTTEPQKILLRQPGRVVRTIIMPPISIIPENTGRVHVGVGFPPNLAIGNWEEQGFVLVEGQKLDVVEQFEGAKEIYVFGNVANQRVWITEYDGRKGHVSITKC